MTALGAVGIVGYGGYVPKYRIDAAEIARIWSSQAMMPGKQFKAVPGTDEDAVTIAIQAARHAMSMADVSSEELGVVWFGSESKPYAVKPSSSIVADAIGALPDARTADWEFACKPGTEAMQAAAAMVETGRVKYAMFGGADTAQARPGDVLEYNTGAGGAAFVLGAAAQSLATLDSCVTFTTNTPDFYRREGQTFPSHGQRFTGKPAYFFHVVSAVQQLFAQTDTGPDDYDKVVFHQPNFGFPLKAASQLGIDVDKVRPFILANEIGNTYSGSALLGLIAALDTACAGDRILLASYGSGASSDACALTVTAEIEKARARGIPLSRYLERQCQVDYAEYARMRGNYIMS